MDPQLDRVLELEDLNYFRYAERIRDCESPRFRNHHCKIARLCPICAERYRRAKRFEVSSRIPRIQNPTALLLTAPIRGPRLLGLGIARLSHAFTVLKLRKVWWSHFGKGIASLEATYNEDSRGWNPHYHVVAEGLKDLDASEFAALQAAWTDLAGKSALLSPPPQGHAIRAPKKYADYLTKGKDWYLTPGVHSPTLVGIHFEGFKGRRLIRTWGDF